MNEYLDDSFCASAPEEKSQIPHLVDVKNQEEAPKSSSQAEFDGPKDSERNQAQINEEKDEKRDEISPQDQT